MNSTIKRKTCKCGCSKMPSMSYNGYFYAHAPQELKDKLELKSKYKKEKKLAKQREQNKIRHLENSQDSIAANKQIELNEWFAARRKQMTGFCKNCGGKSCKDNDKYWKFSIAHILPKSKVKSVATNPLNFIELCFFGNSCHTNFDNGILEMQDMKCWKEIQFNFGNMFPFIDKSEYQFIPDVLIQSLIIEIPQGTFFPNQFFLVSLHTHLIL